MVILKKPVGHIHYSYEDGIDFCHWFSTWKQEQEHVAGAAEELWNCKPNTKPQPYVTPGKPSGHYIFSFLVKEDKAEADGMWAKFQPEYIAF